MSVPAELIAKQIDLSNVYMVVGTLVVLNIGAVGTGLVFIIRLVWIAAKYDSRIEKMERDLNRAFKNIKELKEADE